MPRRTPEDLIFPERIFFRMIDDYGKGRLSNINNKIFKRALVIDVDTVGGLLETRPPNPPGSVRARVYSDGLDATTPNSALTIFYPLFPAHVRPPVERDEHIIVFFEDPEIMSNGLWITTVPTFRDQNFRDPEENRQTPPTTGDRFEGNRREALEEVNRDIEFGGNREETGVQDEIINTFESGVESLFLNKKVLHIGDDAVDGPFGNELGILIQEKGATSYTKVGRSGWGVTAWNRGRLGLNNNSTLDTLDSLIERRNPDIILITLGSRDYLSVNSPDYVSEIQRLWNESLAVPFSIWIGPPTPVGRSSVQRRGINNVVRSIRQVVGPRFVDSRDITTSTGRTANGLDFTPQGGRSWAEQTLNRLERVF